MNEPVPGPPTPDDAAPRRPARLACALPFLLGVAIVIALTLLFYYLLLV